MTIVVFDKVSNDPLIEPDTWPIALNLNELASLEEARVKYLVRASERGNTHYIVGTLSSVLRDFQLAEQLVGGCRTSIDPTKLPALSAALDGIRDREARTIAEESLRRFRENSQKWRKEFTAG